MEAMLFVFDWEAEALRISLGLNAERPLTASGPAPRARV